jgi:hypothetical protein
VVSGSGATYTAACSSGEVEHRLALAADGTFDEDGTLTSWGGAPPPHSLSTTRPARFQGRVSGDRLTLDIVVDGATNVGPLEDLRRNQRRDEALCP